MRFIAVELVFLCVLSAAAAADDATLAAGPAGQAAPELKAEAGKAEKPPAPPKAPGYFDLGFGLGIPDYSDSTPIGWDAMAGYQWMESASWRTGVQLHWLEGTISSYTRLQSVGLLLTTNAKDGFLRWFQLKAGIVHDSYSHTFTQYVSIPTPPYSMRQTQTTAWGGNGVVAGIGFVIPFDSWQLHVLDVEHHAVAGHGYNVYTVSIVVFAELLRGFNP